MARFNGLESGSVHGAVQITTANSGEGGDDAFDAVTVTGDGACTYTDVDASNGSWSMLSSVGASTGRADCSYSLANLTEDYVRVYVQHVSEPSVVRAIVGARSGAGQAYRIGITGSGNIDIRQANNMQVGASVTQISAEQWVRLEWHVIFDGSNSSMELRIYTDPESETAAETVSVNNVDFGSSCDAIRFGVPVNSANAPQVRLDSIAVEGSTWHGPAEPAASVQHHWLSVPTPDGFTVKAKVSNTSSDISMVVASDSELEDVITTFGPITPDALGYVEFEATGLQSQTRYWYQLDDDGTPLGEIGRARTAPPVGEPADFTIAFGGCTRNNNPPREGYDHLHAWEPDLFAHLGDFHYGDPNTTDESIHRLMWENQIQNAGGLKEVLRDVPTVYTRSDHDSITNNADSNVPENQASINAYLDVIPHFPIVDQSTPPRGIWWSTVFGRVRLIFIDVRNMERSPGLDPQDPSKTMLGEDQLEWLLDELDEDEPLKIIFCDPGWLGAASLTNGEDKWWAYDDERQVIADHIQNNNINVVLCHSDSHSLGRCTRGDNHWGGFPVFCAAPFGNIGGGQRLGAFTEVYTGSLAEFHSQYGRLTVTDIGSAISVEYEGYDATHGVVRLQQQDVFLPGDHIEDIEFVGSSGIGHDSAVLSVTIPAPDGVANGDFLLAFIPRLKDATADISEAPAGWTQLDEELLTRFNLGTSVWWKWADNEPGDYTWEFTNFFKAGGWIGAYRGVNPLDPIADFAAADGEEGTLHDTPEVNVRASGWLVTCIGTRHPNTGVETEWSNQDDDDAERFQYASNTGSQDLTFAVYDSDRPLDPDDYSRRLFSSQSESVVGMWSISLRAFAERRSLEDSEDPIIFGEIESPFIEEFTVVFNGSNVRPGFDITLRGLQEATADFHTIEVWRRDPSGRFPDQRVRGLASVLVQDNELLTTDYEAPLNIPLEYYLRLIADSGEFNVGPVLPTPQPYIPTMNDAYGGGTAYLKVVDQPGLSIPLMIEELHSWTHDGRIQATYDVLGRRNPVVVSDVMAGRRGRFSGHCILQMGQPAEAVEGALSPGSTLLIQNNNITMSAFKDMYFKVESVEFDRRTRMVWHGDLDNPPQPEVVVTFVVNYIEVDRPDPTGQAMPVLMWRVLDDTHTNWGHVLDRYDSWQQVLANPFGPGGSES